jgi:periplasmic divalent cation tolerance protein
VIEQGNNTACLVLCTCPDRETAQRLAEELVKARLAACVNVVGDVHSVFRWEGVVQDASEVLMIAKTSSDSYPALEAWLQDSHPYDVPEILMLPVGGGLESYLTWVNKETG